MFSLLKFGIIKFLLLAIASKTIVVLKAITTFASFKNFSPVPPLMKTQFLTPASDLRFRPRSGLVDYNGGRHLVRGNG